MNPCNRLGIRVVALYRARARRLAATAASLMASALDRAPNHTLPKVAYTLYFIDYCEGNKLLQIDTIIERSSTYTFDVMSTNGQNAENK